MIDLDEQQSMLSFYREKYKKTLDLMNFISNRVDFFDVDHVIADTIKKINQTDIKTLEEDITDYLKIKEDRYEYLEVLYHTYPNILSLVLKTQNEKVINAFLDKDVENNNFFSFFHLLTRPKPLELTHLIMITQRLIEQGLDINATEEVKLIKYDPMGGGKIVKEKMNYFTLLIKASLDKETIHLNEDESYTKQTLSDKGEFLLNYFLDQGFELQESKGELIKLAIEIEDKKLIDFICQIKDVDKNYINRGIQLWINEYEEDSWQREEEYDNSEVLNYLKTSFEKTQLEKIIKPNTWAKPMSVKTTKKVKI